MDCLDFHNVTAIIEATASFKHFSLAFQSTGSDGILSNSLVLVMVRATALMDLLMSSVTPIRDRFSSLSLIGIVAHQQAICKHR